jgi:hypothetical protein
MPNAKGHHYHDKDRRRPIELMRIPAFSTFESFARRSACLKLDDCYHYPDGSPAWNGIDILYQGQLTKR